MIRDMNVKVLFSIFAFIIFLILLYFVVFHFHNKKKENDFNQHIIYLDSLINLKSYIKAEKYIFTCEKSVHNAYSYKQLLKRVYMLEDWGNLNLLAENAYKKYSKDDQIFSIYLQSLFKTNKIEIAKQLIDSNKKHSVSEELSLYSNIILGKYEIEDNILYQALDSRDPMIFSKLYGIINNKNLLINKALLNLQRGEFSTADNTLSNLELDDIQYQKLQLLTKYSNGKYFEMLNLLLKYDYGFSNEELSLIKIDINLNQNLYNDAILAIKNFLTFYCDYSVDPYINLIILDFYITIEDIDEYINRAINLFPDNKLLIKIVSNYYLRIGKENIAIGLMEKYLEHNQIDNEIILLLKQLKGLKNPEAFINNIRDLVNENPGNDIISRYFAWSLFKNNNFKDLKLFLNIQKLEKSWTFLFNSLVLIYNNETNIALEQLNTSFELENNWEILYNLGLLYEYLQKYQNAIVSYQNAENIIKNIDKNFTTKSFIRTKLALLFYNIKDYKNSYRELKNALDLDKSNLKAHLLLKKLESSTF